MSLKSLMIVLVLAPAVGLAQTTTPPLIAHRRRWCRPRRRPCRRRSRPTRSNPAPRRRPRRCRSRATCRGSPAKSGYQYSPYGQPKSQEKPGPEIGLMVSESLFGALTAAGVTVLPYFLLFANGSASGNRRSRRLSSASSSAAAPARRGPDPGRASPTAAVLPEPRRWIPRWSASPVRPACWASSTRTGWLPTGAGERRECPTAAAWRG